MALDNDQLEDARRQYEDRLPHHRSFAARLEQLLHGLLDDAVAEVYLISSRCKDPDSFIEKVIRKQSDRPLEEIQDQIGTRVVVLFEADVDEVVAILRRHLTITDVDDKRGNQALGYEAVHMLAMVGSQRHFLPEWSTYRGIVFEIQVRSLLSHTWSEVSHRLNYKKVLSLPPKQEKALRAAIGSLTLVDNAFNELRLVRREMDSGLGEENPVDE